jgi:hypothetical protein
MPTASNHDEPIPPLRQSASLPEAAESYERLAELRQAAVTVKDSGFPWAHERTHLEEIISRIDATVRLKRERDEHHKTKAKAT